MQIKGCCTIYMMLPHIELGACNIFCWSDQPFSIVLYQLKTNFRKTLYEIKINLMQ